MRIAVDLRSVVAQRTGIGEYARELANGLAGSHWEDSFIFLGGTSARESLATASSRVQWEQSRPQGRYRRMLWENLVLPRMLAEHNVDVFHDPEPLLPFRRLPCATVATVPDTTPFSNPEWYSGIAGRRYRLHARRSIESADLVIAVSEAVRKDVLRLFRISPDRVVTIHLAASRRFSASHGPNVSTRLRERLPSPFILSVGGLEPRKNQARLIQAFDRIADSHASLELVLAGRRGWSNDDVHVSVDRARAHARIRFLDYVPDDDLPQLYRMALALAYPSLSEGFGLPVLEAMASGIPVLTSDTSALPEIAGDAALLVDPLDVTAIADGLHRIVTDEDLRSELRRRGLARAAGFSWERTTQLTRASYDQAIENRRTRRRP